MRFATSLLTGIFILTTLSVFAQTTSGTLTVSATTSSTGGTYAPKNIVAIWIETESGTFVKTLLAYGNKRITHLNTWEASTTKVGSVFNNTDAITGATQSSHAKRTCTWDGTNVAGTVVPDGNYVVWFELTDKNATGNVTSVAFTKGTAQVQLSPANKPSFSSINMAWNPTTSSYSETDKPTLNVFPNPTSGVFQIQNPNISAYQVINLNGQVVMSGSENRVDISDQPCGIYVLQVKYTSGQQSVLKLIKK